MSIRLILLFATLILTACSTNAPLAYDPSVNGSTGYFDRQKSTNKWMVGYYFNVYNQSPQQAANIVMLHATKKGGEEQAKWVRILHYDTEKRQGPIASLPAYDDLEASHFVRGMYFYGNLDAAVTDSQIRHDVNYALVEYFEFARDIDCQAQKCGNVEYSIEECSADKSTPIPKTVASKCSEAPESDSESCVEPVQYLSKDFCSKVSNATRSPRGMVEERDPNATGSWYSVEELLKKYSQRYEKWLTVKK